MTLMVIRNAMAQDRVKEDFRPSEVNQPGKQFPQVNSEGRIRVQIEAPDAKYVQLDIGGVKYDLKKNEQGVWCGESAPQDEGFHYYQLNIDGASVPDPGTRYFYGAGRWGSGIEIPAHDQAFYALKDVPHGQVSELKYFSEITQSWRRCFVYTPPCYDAGCCRSKGSGIITTNHPTLPTNGSPGADRSISLHSCCFNNLLIKNL